MTGERQALTLSYLDRIAWRFGATRHELHTMSLQEWQCRLQAYNANERAEWGRTLAVVNTVRGIVGGDPIDMDGGTQPRQDRDTGREQYEALKGRHMDWIMHHTRQDNG